MSCQRLDVSTLLEDTVLAYFLVRLPANRKTQQICSTSPRRNKCLQSSVTDRENGIPWVALVCNVIHVDSGIQSYIVNRYNSRSVTFIVVWRHFCEMHIVLSCNVIVLRVDVLSSSQTAVHWKVTVEYTVSARIWGARFISDYLRHFPVAPQGHAIS